MSIQNIKIKPVTNQYGEMELQPDDIYGEVSVSIENWLTLTPPASSDIFLSLRYLRDRCEIFTAVLTLHCQECGDDTDLRESGVMPIYDSVNQVRKWMFIFKHENNGNTFRYTVEEVY